MFLGAWWREKRWFRRTVIGVAAVVVAYGGYMVFARWSNGTDTDVFVEAGTNPDGSMYFHCDPTRSSLNVCSGPSNHSTVTVGHRDRVHLTVHSNDGGGRAHDFKVTGWAYAFPYPWVELELHQETETETFTTWKSGTFMFFCELPGHEQAGMWGALVVQ